MNVAPGTVNRTYRRLSADHIATTIRRLRERIAARFPDANLGRVCDELHAIAGQARDRARWIATPNPWFRWSVVAVIVLLVIALVLTIAMVPHDVERFNIMTLVEMLDAGLNDIVLIGAAMIFLVTAESRLKRRRALQAIDELRAVAQVIDMHQLTKDPDRVFARGRATDVSPSLELTPFELTRYLDYCSEMLSLTAKVASVYGQALSDPVVYGAVSELEALCTGLSRKIWQKVMIIHKLEEIQKPAADTADAAAPSTGPASSADA